MALSIPELPAVTVWHAETDERFDRVVKLLSDFGCETKLRHVLEDRPTEKELADIATYVQPGPSTLLARSLRRELGVDDNDGPAIARAIANDPSRLRGPLVLSDRRKAIVARPPEMSYAVLIPELPEGETAASMMRRVIQGKLTS